MVSYQSTKWLSWWIMILSVVLFAVSFQWLVLSVPNSSFTNCQVDLVILLDCTVLLSKKIVLFQNIIEINMLFGNKLKCIVIITVNNSWKQDNVTWVDLRLVSQEVRNALAPHCPVVAHQRLSTSSYIYCRLKPRLPRSKEYTCPTLFSCCAPTSFNFLPHFTSTSYNVISFSFSLR